MGNIVQGSKLVGLIVCVNKNERGLGLIDLKEAFITFLCKCTISALKIRETNLKTLVCLFDCMSSKHKR